MMLHYVAADGEPQSGAVHSGFTWAAEWLENTFLKLSGDAGTGILHTVELLPIAPSHSNVNVCAVPGMDHGIADQILEELHQQWIIPERATQRIHMNRGVMLFDQMARVLDCLANDRIHIDRLHRDPVFVAGECKIESFCHKAAEPAGGRADNIEILGRGLFQHVPDILPDEVYVALNGMQRSADVVRNKHGYTRQFGIDAGQALLIQHQGRYILMQG